MATISTITLTYNEEADIVRCLNSLQWADERIVIDSYSRDATEAKAKPLCTKFIKLGMSDFSSIRNIGIKEAKGEWILMVDADEVIPPEMAEEIHIAVNSGAFAGYFLNRINYMYGIRLNYDQPDYILRLFKKDKAIFKNPVHEEAVVDGAVSKLKNNFFHYSMRDLKEHIHKMNLYTDIASSRDTDSSALLFMKPFYRLAQQIIIKKAYKDGMVGIILSLNAFFYEFINLFKVWERRFMKRDWLDFYKGIDINSEMPQQALVHKEFINAIFNSQAKSILEVGSGAASMAMHMIKNKHLNIVTVDNRPDILKKVAENAKGLGVSIKCVCADAFKLPFKDNSFGLIYSQGLLEHFNDSQIKKAILESLRVSSDKVMLSVPNNYYKHKDIGDERLLSKQRWENILSDFNIRESRNYFYKRTKKNFLRLRPLMYMCVIGKR